LGVRDGEVRQEFTFLYAAEIESGELKIDDESKEAAWVPLSSAVKLSLAESQIRRLKDVMEYQKEQRTFFEVPSIGVRIPREHSTIDHASDLRGKPYNIIQHGLFSVIRGRWRDLHRNL